MLAFTKLLVFDESWFGDGVTLLIADPAFEELLGSVDALSLTAVVYGLSAAGSGTLSAAVQVSADGRDETFMDSDMLINGAVVSARGVTAVLGATSSTWIPGKRVRLQVQTAGNSAFRVKIYATGRRNDTNNAEPSKSCAGGGGCGGGSKCGGGSTERAPGNSAQSAGRAGAGTPPAMMAPASPALPPSSRSPRR